MTHITTEQRYTIWRMRDQRFSQVEIGQAIEKDKSVICRELKRNSDARSGEYRYDLALKKHAKRQKEKRKHRYFSDDVKESIELLLQDDYSPEQVVGMLKKENRATVSVERIYQHIWKDKRVGGLLFTHLRRKGRKNRKRGSSKDNRGIIKNRVSIDQRPDLVDKRERFGDLEVDLIIGKNHNQAILTINDRASGMLKMKKVSSKESAVVTIAINQLLEDWVPYIHTITADNGKEFAGHKNVAEQLNIDYFFAHPYHSWERGSNENLNGLVRQYFAKGADFTRISQQEIQRVENKLNNRPRKRYNYENPIFVMNQLLFNTEVAFMT